MTIQSKLDRLADEIYPEGRQFIDTDTATFRVRKEWAEKLRAIRAAVGGEAVPPVAWMDPRSGRTIHANEYSGVVKIGPLGDPGKLVPCREVYTAPLYASPPATVDVGAVRKLVEKWRGITTNTDIEYGSRVFIEGYDKALNYCADELAALIGKEA